jgi:hypothetical protein
MPELYQQHQVDPNTRIAVYVEEDYEGIVDVLHNTEYAGIQTIRNHQWLSAIETNDDLADVVKRIRYSYQWRYDEDAKTEAVFTRYLSMRGIPFIQKTLRGYSPSEWHDVVIYAIQPHVTLEHLEALVEDVEALYRGDVYRLVVEKRVVYTADNGNTIERWEQDEDWDTQGTTGNDSITELVTYMTGRILADKVSV